MDFNVAAVIFDNDGTLVDSRAGLLRAWLTWSEEHGVAPERLLGHDGRSSFEIVQILLEETGRDANPTVGGGRERTRAAGGAAAGARAGAVEAAHARIEHLETAEAHDTVIHDGAAEALSALPPERVAIATAGTREVATARLESAGIVIPPVFVTANDISAAKPDPEIFLAAAERLGVAAEDCLVVEDAPYGVAAGKAAGCAVLAVTTTVTRDRLADADAVVDSLDQVAWEIAKDGRILVTIR